jgi:hypothetical protein
MPKLAPKDQERVAEAEETTGGFDPLPSGKYVATLKSVEDKLSKKGNAMWGVAFEEIHDLDGNKQPGQQFTNLVLAGDDDDIPEDYVQTEASLKRDESREEAWINRNAFLNGKIKRFFSAFGYTSDSDTDEMIGERCVLKIKKTTIGEGKRKGEPGNEIDDFLPLDSVDFEDGDGAAGADDDF